MPRGNRCHGKDNYNRERGMWGDQENVRAGEGAGHVAAWAKYSRQKRIQYKVPGAESLTP